MLRDYSPHAKALGNYTLAQVPTTCNKHYNSPSTIALAVGYDDQWRAIIVLNSWGVEWGTIRYERLRQDISQLRACLRSNSPFVFGLKVYQSFHTKQEQDGEILEPTQEESLEGLHAALAVGYDDQWRAIIVLNSWGAEWGMIRYERLRQDISQLRACLRSNSPFLFGLKVYQSFHTKQEQDGEILEPTQEESLEDLHAALAVGYDDQWRAIIVLNSWGAERGDCGYFYMPYALIEDAKMCFDFWKISFASEGAATSKGAKGSSSSESGKSTSKGAEGNGSSERGKPPNFKTPTPTFKGAKGSGTNERGKSPTPTSKGAESSKRGNPNLKTPTPTSKGAKGSGSSERGKSTSKSAEGSGSNKRGKTHLKTPTPTSKGAKGSGSNERGKSPIPTSKGAEGNKRGKSPTPSSKGAEGSGTPTPSSIPSPTSTPTSSSTPSLNLSPTPGPGPMKKGTQKCNPETPPPRVLGMEKSYSQTGLPQTLSDGPCLSPYAFLDIIIYQQPPSSSFYQQRPRKKRHRRYHISRNWMSLKLKQRGSRSHCSMIQYQSDEYHNDISKMRRIVYFRQQGDEVTETSYLLSRYTKIQNRQKTCSIYDYCDNHNKKKRERSRRNDRDLKSFLRDDIIRK